MKKKLSPSVIKEAIDNLPMGLAFAGDDGRLILTNRIMAELGSALIGSQPQMRQEIENALAGSRAVTRIEEDPPLYRFPDGRVWRFRTVALEEPSGYTQTTAQDMTELYHTAARLRRENDELRQVSREIKEMYARRGDRIRDMEVLEMKMRIHDNIGSALLTLTDLMEKGDLDGVDDGLNVLRDAVSYLTRDRTAPGETIDEVRRWAAAMRVELRVTGVLPEDGAVLDLIAAAARECVTNCIRHAGGSTVTVDSTEQDGRYTVVLTNDGRPPEGDIVEGVGLSSLRSKVELMGGEMAVSHTPSFSLTLDLSEGGRL